MISWLVWIVIAAIAVLLTAIGYWFSIRTLRIVTLIIALVLLVVITRYGLTRPAKTPPDLANSFTRGADALSVAFFRPVLALVGRVPAPGRVGWIVIAIAIIIGYRQLEAWVIRRQAPTLDMSALGGDQPGASTGDTASAGGAEAVTAGPSHDELAAEVKFRLAAMELRAPAILPGGSRTAALASIAQSSGISVGGLAGAIIQFCGMIWPTPRQLQLRVWIEPTPCNPEAAAGPRVTAVLEYRGSDGGTAKTLAADNIGEAASMVAGYVGRQIFAEDPTTPPWCYGASDGRDLGAYLLAKQERVYLESAAAVEYSRQEQISRLEKVVAVNRCAGIVRYELASLYDLDGRHLAALRLHAINREQYPRFYRGRYRLAMSVEMICNPEFKLSAVDADMLEEVLDILARCGLLDATECVLDGIDRVTWQPRDCLRAKLLAAAQEELAAIRRQLSLWSVLWATLARRDERAVWRPYWQLRRRQSFRDGVCVGELLVAVRQRMLDPDAQVGELHEDLALRIATAIAGDPGPIRSVLRPQDKQRQPPLTSADTSDRPRWQPAQCRTASWPAAYNTACLYATLAARNAALEKQVVTSLKRAINNPDSEMERAYDWISHDPDFRLLKDDRENFPEFNKFLGIQRRRDYPLSRRPGRPGRPERPGRTPVP